MIQIDIDKPKTCAECLISCRDSFYEIYCRNNMKKHEPFDKDCPLKEVPTGKWVISGEDWICDNCKESICEIYDEEPWEDYCPNCGAKMEVE